MASLKVQIKRIHLHRNTGLDTVQENQDSAVIAVPGLGPFPGYQTMPGNKCLLNCVLRPRRHRSSL